MIQPVDDPIGQDFGANPTRNNPDPVFGDYQPFGHSGRDYKCWAGTPVRAVTSGTVLHIGRMGGTYDQNPWWIQPSFAGYVAVIDHGAFIAIYGHCMDGSARVRKGDRVAEGQVFILSGNTGASTGDHLHFEILPDGYVLNSAMYGRINPATIFGGITTQAATISPVEQVTPAPKSEPNSGDKMLVLATNGSEPQVWAGDGILRRPIWTLDTMSASQWLAQNKVLGPFYKDGEVQTIPDLNAIGIDIVSLAGKGA